MTPTDWTVPDALHAPGHRAQFGVAKVADHRRPDGGGNMVPADPEGNEFCVARSVEEIQSTA